MRAVMTVEQIVEEHRFGQLSAAAAGIEMRRTLRAARVPLRERARLMMILSSAPVAWWPDIIQYEGDLAEQHSERRTVRAVEVQHQMKEQARVDRLARYKRSQLGAAAK
jgi:hypothetical protein